MRSPAYPLPFCAGKTWSKQRGGQAMGCEELSFDGLVWYFLVGAKKMRIIAGWDAERYGLVPESLI